MDAASPSDIPKPDDFPDRFQVESFDGELRIFKVEMREPPVGGVIVTASEVKADDDSSGYVFNAYSETNPYIALGELRAKAKQRLSVRHLRHTDEGTFLTHDCVEGRIGCEGVIVDGNFITFDSFIAIIQTYEGFRFSLSVRDSADSIPQVGT